jgi:hypothetical protein
MTAALPSYNHDVRYRGCTFHVQTEHLMAPRPALVTHLFCAGDIVATWRATEVGLTDPFGKAHQTDGRTALSLTRMQAQHQQAMRSLIRGELDDRLAARGLPLESRGGHERGD